jgi:hypothetical protein
MKMAECEVTVESPVFKDKKVRLVVFGVLQIILGSLCALIVPLIIVGMIAAHKNAAEGVNFKAIIPGTLFYVLLAVWFIWMGIGSVMARRWARAIILISSWLWLIGGVLGFIFILRIIPNMYDKMSESGQISEAMVTGMKIGMITFMAIFYVIIPGLLVLFYSGRNVKATCEYRDPKIRWTDKCPSPVLAISLMTAVWAISMLSMGIYNWTLPFFGVILSGTAGEILILVLILLFAYAAWGLYKLNIKAWWCLLLVIIGWSVSTIITFSRVNMQDYYDKMGFSAQQLEYVKQFNMSNMIWFCSLWAAAVIAYLLYIRKYFVSGLQKNTSSQVSGQT